MIYWLRRFSAVELLLAIVLLIVVSPFVGQLPGGASIDALLMTVVLFSAVLAIGERVRTLRLAALLVAPAVVARWLHHFRPDLLPQAVYLILALVFIAFVVVRLLRFVLRASLVNAEVLCAGIVIFLMLGMILGFCFCDRGCVRSWRLRVRLGRLARPNDGGLHCVLLQLHDLERSRRRRHHSRLAGRADAYCR